MRRNTIRIKMSKLIYLLFICIIGLSLSCEPKKIIVIETEPINSKKLYKKFTEARDEIQNILVKKVSIKYKSEKERLSVNGSIAIIKDSLINIRLTPILGIQAYNILINRDSVFVIDRIKKVVYKDKFSMLEKILKREFLYEDLQSVFINNFVLSKNFKEIKILNKRTELSKGLHKINTLDFSNKKVGKIFKNYSINDQNNRIEKLEYYDALKNRIKIFYNNYSMESGVQIPKEINIIITKNIEEINLKLVYNKILINDNFKINAKMPKSYEVKSLKSL